MYFVNPSWDLTVALVESMKARTHNICIHTHETCMNVNILPNRNERSQSPFIPLLTHLFPSAQSGAAQRTSTDSGEADSAMADESGRTHVSIVICGHVDRCV